MLHLKQENIFGWLDIKFLKNHKDSKFRLAASLPAHICKPRCQKKHRTATILQHNNKLTSEMCLLGFGASAPCYCFYLPLGSSLHAAKPYQCVNFSNQHWSWAVYLDATTSILKRLCYSRGIGQVQVRYFECKMRVKRSLKWVWQHQYTWPTCCHFVLESSASFWLIKHGTKRMPCPFWQGFKSMNCGSTW